MCWEEIRKIRDTCKTPDQVAALTNEIGEGRREFREFLETLRNFKERNQL
jgi:hypothetical protein